MRTGALSIMPSIAIRAHPHSLLICMFFCICAFDCIFILIFISICISLYIWLWNAYRCPLHHAIDCYSSPPTLLGIKLLLIDHIVPTRGFILRPNLFIMCSHLFTFLSIFNQHFCATMALSHICKEKYLTLTVLTVLCLSDHESKQWSCNGNGGFYMKLADRSKYFDRSFGIFQLETLQYSI